jgi:hypothetical protein
MLILPKMAPPHHTTTSPYLPRALLRYVANTVKHLSILILKAFIVALAIFVLPRTIHTIVRCFDDLNEMMGRRAKSPFEGQALCRGGVVVALGLLVGWHCVLGRLSYRAIVEEDEDGDGGVSKVGKEIDEEKVRKGKGVTWGRVLGRIIIPGLLGGLLMVLVWMSGWRMNIGRPLVTANTVDLEDDARAGLVWRDR